MRKKKGALEDGWIVGLLIAGGLICFLYGLITIDVFTLCVTSYKALVIAISVSLDLLISFGPLICYICESKHIKSCH